MNKKVIFSETTKKHDGLCRLNYVLDTLIMGYFDGKITSLEDVREIIGNDLYLYPMILGKMDELDSRATCSMSDVAILPGGGGSCGRIEQDHLEHLRILREYIAKSMESRI